MANVIIMNMKMKDFPDFESVGENLSCYAFLLLCGYWNSIFLTYFFKDNNLIFPYGVGCSLHPFVEKHTRMQTYLSTYLQTLAHAQTQSHRIKEFGHLDYRCHVVIKRAT